MKRSPPSNLLPRPSQPQPRGSGGEAGAAVARTLTESRTNPPSSVRRGACRISTTMLLLLYARCGRQNAGTVYVTDA